MTRDFLEQLCAELEAGRADTALVMVRAAMLLAEPERSSAAERTARWRANKASHKASQTPSQTPSQEASQRPSHDASQNVTRSRLARASEIFSDQKISKSFQREEAFLKEKLHSDAREGSASQEASQTPSQSTVTQSVTQDVTECASQPWLVAARTYQAAYERTRGMPWQAYAAHRRDLESIASTLGACARRDGIALEAACARAWEHAWADAWMGKHACPIGVIARDPARWYAPPKGPAKLGRYEPSPDDFAHVAGTDEAAQ